MSEPLPDPETEPVIDIQRAGRILGIAKNSAYAAAHAGQIPTIKIGRRLVVPTAKLLDMLGLTPAA